MTLHAALDFLRAHRGEDIDTAIATFRTVIAQFGFSCSAAGSWVGSGATRVHRFYFNTWPLDWLEIYERQAFFTMDPVVAEARRRLTPFLWSEMERQGSIGADAAEVLRHARDYGWQEVLAVPIHGPAGYQGIVSMASLEPVTLDRQDMALLRILSLTIHDKCREIIGFGAATRDAVALTAREAECMKWVASGKTDADIALILGVSKATVHFHIEGAKKKLSTRSRSEAIALLVLQGIV